MKMKNDLIPTAKLLEVVSHDPPALTPQSASCPWRSAESHPGGLETLDTVPNSPDSFDHVLCAVQECRAKPPGNYQRIVDILAPHDPTRSRLAGALAKRCRATIGTAASIRRRPSLEPLMRPYFLGQRPILIIDQAERMSREELDFLKSLINLTPVVLVLLATPRAFQNWRHCWPVEFRQLHRRTHLVLERQPRVQAIHP